MSKEELGAHERLRAIGRACLALLLIGGATAAWLERGSIDPAAIEIAMDQNSLGVIAYLAIHVIATLIFIPRTILGIAAGLLFGLWWGLIWASVGMMAGTAIGLMVARYVNDGAIELEGVPRIGPLLVRAERGGWRWVAVFRLIPGVSHSLGNYVLAMTRLPFATLFLGSIVGQLPSTLLYVYLGEAGEGAALGESDLILQLSLIAALVSALAMLGAWLRRRTAMEALAPAPMIAPIAGGNF